MIRNPQQHLIKNTQLINKTNKYQNTDFNHANQCTLTFPAIQFSYILNINALIFIPAPTDAKIRVSPMFIL
jgi:hypothetical protein